MKHANFMSTTPLLMEKNSLERSKFLILMFSSDSKLSKCFDIVRLRELRNNLTGK